MLEQEITIQTGDDPFDTKTIKVKVPKGEKILCTESYVAELAEIYQQYDNAAEASSKIEEHSDYIVQGEVVHIKYENDEPIEALIDISRKYTAVCYLQKESKHVVDQLKKGTLVDVKVRKGNGELMIASISDALDEVKAKEIMEAIGNKSIGFTAKVAELIHGGYWVDVGGIRCFMPGSLGGVNKLHDFNVLVGKEIIVMPITYSKDKETIVVSHREYLRTLIPTAVENLKENIKNKVEGFVTGATKFGIFAEFNQCLTGLIPKAELDEATQELFNNRDIKPGDPIEFWTKEIISDKKIILSQKGPKVDLWDGVQEKYTPMMIVDGKVTKLTKYGAFVELEKGISGLIHKTKLKDIEVTKGDTIKVKIQSVNASDRKITMNLVQGTD
jgi:ribosomal protein S1